MQERSNEQPTSSPSEHKTPGGLLKGLQTYVPHDGERARQRRLRQMQRQEDKECRRRCIALGIDPDEFIGPERARR